MKDFEKKIDYKFKNKDLLKLAFIHSSYREEHSDTIKENNERLEFLGDAVLGCAITHLLYIQYPYKSEGDLSKVKAYLVGESSLSDRAEDLLLSEHLLLGAGEEKHGGRKNKRLLSSTLEAVIGAIFLDSDYTKAESFIEKTFEASLKNINTLEMSDYKTELQEAWQKAKKITPTYKVVQEEGPSHKKEFTIEVFANDKVVGMGKGKSKKEAEQNAAKIALASLEGGH